MNDKGLKFGTSGNAQTHAGWDSPCPGLTNKSLSTDLALEPAGQSTATALNEVMVIIKDYMEWSSPCPLCCLRCQASPLSRPWQHTQYNGQGEDHPMT